MTSAKAMLRPILHKAIGVERTSALSARFNEARSKTSYQLLPAGRQSADRLRALKDSHRGQRCFIIGNGPSLRSMDLSPLRDEFTFGLNRVYLMFDKLGFATDFLVCVNSYVVEQSGAEIAGQPSMKFVSWATRRAIPKDADITYIRSSSHRAFSTDAASGVWEGATVTFVAMQVAYLMGFQRVILIGVDHSFATKGTPHQLVQSQSDDPNHFDPSYFGKGYRWQLPDLETSEIAYRMARRAFEADGRQILDATVGGRLEVFVKTDYAALFPERLKRLAS